MITPTLALTMGEPGGIGGEIAISAWHELQNSGEFCFLVIDDPDRLRALAAGNARIIEIGSPAEAAAAFGTGLPVLAETLPAPIHPGEPTPENAAATIRSIERAAVLAREGQVAAMVTNPIDKKALHSGAGFRYPGHTDFLASLTGQAVPVMMLAAETFRTVPVTVHIPFREVPGCLTRKAILHAGRVTAQALRDNFGIDRARLAVAGLNPHAGEAGLLGDEEEKVIGPAVADLRQDGIDASGPFSSDTMFRPEARAGYDAAICMYHDQALIPIKTLDFSATVNVTLGLPIVRTSPGHGVAYDLAGTGRADPAPLLAALRLAAEMADRRESCPRQP